METDITQFDTPNETKRIPLLICSYCLKSVPLLIIEHSYRKIVLKVKCVCMEKSRKVSLTDFVSNLLKMSQAKDNHCFKCLSSPCLECTSPVIIECSPHNKPFSVYCKRCQVNCCSICQEGHKSHRLIDLFFEDYADANLMLTFKEAKAINRERTRILIEKLKAIPRLEMIEKLQLACLENASNNEAMEILYESICKTALALKSYPSFELITLRRKVHNNLEALSKARETLIEGERGFEEEFDQLLTHLRYNTVLEQVEMEESIATLTGHQSVSSLIQLTDGRLASSSSDCTIKLWNVSTFECITTQHGHNKVTRLIQLRNGRLASSSVDTTIKLWDIKTFACTGILSGSSWAITPLLQLKDGRLASDSEDSGINLWNTTTNECTASLKGHEHYVLGLVQLNDSQLVSCSYDVTVKVWNLETYECITTLDDFTDFPSCFTLLSDGRLAVGFEDKIIKLLNTTSWKCCETLTEHKGSIFCVMQVSDGRLASGSYDGTIKLWNTIINECHTTLERHT